MRKLFYSLRYLERYKSLAALNIVFNILSVIFSLCSITMVIPFLDYLFNQNQAGITSVYNGNAFGSIKNYFYSFIQNYIAGEDAVAPGSGRMKALVLICLAALTAVFLKNVCRYMAMYFLAGIRNGVIRDLRNNIFGKMLLLPLGFYSDERKGDIMSRITNDVTEIEWSVMSTLEVIFREPLTILLSLITLAFISLQLTLTVFIVIPIAAGIISIAGKSLRRNSTKAKNLLGQLISNVEEVLGGLKVLKSFTAGPYVMKRFYDINEAYTKVQNKVYRRTDLSAPLSEFMGTIAVVLVMFYGGKLVLSGQGSFTGSDLIGYIALFSQIIPPAKAITSAYYNIQKGLASSDRVNKILHAEETITDKPGAVIKQQFEKSISFNNVSFSYGKKNVLHNVNLNIAKGKTIALVGPSGGGKSTLVDLLSRFYECDGGSVRIDDTDVRDLTVYSLRNLIAYVPQETVLFNDSVAANISFGNDKATGVEIEAAARIANAHGFISQLTNGYQTNIGDKGHKLSGGQKQRLSIARAVLKNAPILVLDEATSALDTESEKAVQLAIDNLMKNRTSIIIAHRLSTVQHADEIIVLKEGKIEEKGTHAQLYENNGLYRRLCDMQELV